MSTTSPTRIPLDVIEVDKPCPVSWDSMRGDERVRFCGECSLHVYNLSAMSRSQAEALVNARETGERMCVRFYRRADGTVITQDCGGGVRAAARRAARWAAAAAGAVLCAALSPIGLKAFFDRDGNRPTVNAPATTSDWLFPAPAPAVVVGMMPAPVMGDVVSPPPATQPAPREFLGGKRRHPVTGEITGPEVPTTQPVAQ